MLSVYTFQEAMAHNKYTRTLYMMCELGAALASPR